ncbi:MAG: endopeptidase La [[Clostridium] aminophilum]|uniref:endopeptidase La n=1 Tax=[Clostridium] aminophilum TaxID=1526 RepID=UPI0026F27BC9|nr:endopeptidase La [[Clostridium] aminophilum]MDD6196546.1 endopeptidase La [[Clostridium] aminophilum]
MIVIPVYNAILLPGIHLYFKKKEFRQTSGRDAVADEPVTFLYEKELQNHDSLTADNFYPVGAEGVIEEIGENDYVTLRVDRRITVEHVTIEEDKTMRIASAVRKDTDDLPEEEERQIFEKLRRALVTFVDSKEGGAIVRPYIVQWENVAEILSSLSSWLLLTNEEKYSFLAEDSARIRMHQMEKALYEFLEMSKLTGEAQDEQEEDYHRMVRESAIRRQLDYLQDQLDEMHPEDVSDIRMLKMKIKESGMNDEARKEAEHVLKRIEQEGTQSQEYGMLYDYLDFVTGLSWKKEPARRISLTRAEKILDEDHFGLKKVKSRILQQIAVMDLNKKQSGSIILFVGAPGTGKTSIGQSIARALGRQYVRVSLGGVRDEADIRGHRRTYLGAMAGRIMEGIRRSGVSNPVMVLDEVDKLSSSYNGDPASALLEVLDPEQNFSFTDHYMNVPYDLSDVFFICTANTLDTIPEPLLNRMEVINFPGYTATDKFEIAKQYLLPKARKAMGIKETQLTVGDESIRKIIADFTAESGVRGLKKRMETLCRAAAVEIVKNKGKGLDVKPEDLRKLLDMKPIRHDQALKKKAPGVVTGLAWTSAGGEILYIETILMKGSGRITVTGQLGDVMKESAQIALSLVKSMFPEKGRIFKDNDIHIHIPEGAVPKDGPSAGITLTTALASLITGRAVSPEYAMTGEVSLRGVVMPIGGLPEKLMAAVRAGVKKVLIPEENTEDLEDVADEVKNKLEIIPVRDVREVLVLTKVMTKARASKNEPAEENSSGRKKDGRNSALKPKEKKKTKPAE